MPITVEIPPNAKLYLSSVSGLQRTDMETAKKHRPYTPNAQARYFCYVGEKGSGKSKAITKILMRQCLDGAPINRLPIITHIHADAKPSRLIKVLDMALPTKHARCIGERTLTISGKVCINPFDTFLGATKPHYTHKPAIYAWLSTLLSVDGKTPCASNVTDFIKDLMDAAFTLTHGPDLDTHKKYHLAQNFKLDAVVMKSGVLATAGVDKGQAVGGSISYADLARYLHAEGNSKPLHSADQKELFCARDIAHYHSMPVLPDLLSVLSSPALSKYDNLVLDGTATLRDHAWTVIRNAIDALPCFSQPTNIDTHGLSVVSLNLSEVFEGADDRQKLLFLQLACMEAYRNIGYRRSDTMSGYVDDLYFNHYAKQISIADKLYKAVVIEGLSLAKDNHILQPLLERDLRERRPLGVELMFTANNLTDLANVKDDASSDLITSATSLALTSTPVGADRALFEQVVTDNLEVLEDLDKIDDKTMFLFNHPQAIRDANSLYFTNFAPKFNRPH